MFDIVLGATARRDMAEVQLFVHYLNLNRQADTHEQGEWGDRGEKKETKEGMTSRQIRAAEKSRSDGSLNNRKKWPWSVCMEDTFSVNSMSPLINDCSALCDTGWEHGTVGKGWGNYATALLWLKTVGAANKRDWKRKRQWIKRESLSNNRELPQTTLPRIDQAQDKRWKRRQSTCRTIPDRTLSDAVLACCSLERLKCTWLIDQ